MLKELFTPLYLARLAISFAFSVVTVTVVAWTVTWFVADWAIEKALTAQTAHIQGVEGTVLSNKESNEKAVSGLEDALNRLSDKIDALGGKLETSSQNVAELNGTVGVLNASLNSSITRQASFERFVIAQLLKEDPGSLEPTKALGYWKERGLDFDTYKILAEFPESDSLATWLKYGQAAP
jgi:hypothetical protein